MFLIFDLLFSGILSYNKLSIRITWNTMLVRPFVFLGCFRNDLGPFCRYNTISYYVQVFLTSGKIRSHCWTKTTTCPRRMKPSAWRFRMVFACKKSQGHSCSRRFLSESRSTSDTKYGVVWGVDHSLESRADQRFVRLSCAP